MSAPLDSMIDYDALARAVGRELEVRRLDQKQVARAAGIDSSKLTNLLKRRGGLSVNNLFALCDWLGKPVDSYRVQQPPAWLVERLAEGNDLSREEAERLARERANAARRQLAAARRIQGMSRSEVDDLAAAATKAAAHAK